MAVITQNMELAVTLRLTNVAGERLAQRAAQSGQDVANYVSCLLEQALQGPSIEQALVPIQEMLFKSGRTEQELIDMGRSELDAMRMERKSKSA